MTTSFPTSNDDVTFASPVRSGANGWRRAAAIAVLVIMMGLLFFGSLFHVASKVVGNASTTSGFVIGLVSTPTVSADVADAALTSACSHVSTAVCDSIKSNHAALVTALQHAFNSASNQALFRGEIAQLYHAADSSQPVQISFTPLVQQFADALHNADASIPAQYTIFGNNFSEHINGHNPLHLGVASFASYLVMAVALIGMVLAARFLIRHPVRQLVAVGLAIGLPALMDLVVGHGLRNVTSHFKTTTALAKSLLQHIFNGVGTQFIHVGAALVLIDVLVILVWLVARMVADRRRGSTPTTPAIG